MANETKQKTNEDPIQRLNERINQIREEAKADVKFRKDDPFEKHNVELMIKWIDRKIEWLKLARAYETQRKEKFRKLFEFYKTDFDLKLNSKDEYLLFIESTPEYVLIHNAYLTAKDALNFIDSTIDTLKSRGFEIKTFCEWEKFRNGQ